MNIALTNQPPRPIIVAGTRSESPEDEIKSFKFLLKLLTIPEHIKKHGMKNGTTNVINTYQVSLYT